MKLNKRELRKFADPKLKMRSGNGILHAVSVKYIVQTAVKIIDRHKTLILYIYPRERAACGDFKPLWTMFYSHDEYVTLEQNQDGTSKWRTSSFANLDKCRGFASKFAFYSASDEKRLQKYFKNIPDSGFYPLIKAQNKILDRRSRERQIIKEKQIISRMSCVKPLPRGLKTGYINLSCLRISFMITSAGEKMCLAYAHAAERKSYCQE